MCKRVTLKYNATHLQRLPLGLVNAEAGIIGYCRRVKVNGNPEASGVTVNTHFIMSTTLPAEGPVVIRH